jgi:putative superfamily III holin-X
VTAPTDSASAPGNAGTQARQGSTEQDIREVSVGQLLSDVSRDFSTLMRQEVALAKAEVKQEVTKAAKGAGMLGGAGYAGHMLVLFLSLAAWWALAGATNHIGLSALIVAVIWGVIAAVLFVVGRGTLKKVNPKPERTVETVSEIPPALKPNS